MNSDIVNGNVSNQADVLAESPNGDPANPADDVTDLSDDNSNAPGENLSLIHI